MTPRTDSALKPLLREAAPRISAAGGGAFWPATRFHHGEADFPRHILASEEFASTGGDLFALYCEMEEKDGHLFAALQTRKNGVLARRRRILPAANTDHDRAVAAFIEETIEAIPNFNQVLFNILDALGKGLSVQEILWRPDPDGRIRIAEVKSRYPGRFFFDEEGRLCLAGPHAPAFASAWNGRGMLEQGAPLPPRKFIVFSFGGQYSNPYGKGLLSRAFWYYWFKKNNLKFWGIYNEKFGAPTAVARYGLGVPEEERRRLLDVLDSLQSDSGVIIPENIALEFLESRSGGAAATFRELADWCNDEMSKIVLGQTLTSGEGRRSGSLALGQVHQEVRNEYIESDANDLMAVINGQLIPWLVQFNFPAGTPMPRFVIDTSADDDLSAEVEIDRRLLALGIPLSSSYFYERYRRPAPREDERPLRFDDQNLFQYHMRYGVLTVNEVRARLGLAPVPWGNERTQAQDGLPASTAASKAEDPPEATEDPVEKSDAQMESEPAEK